MKDHEQVDALEYSVDEQKEEYKEWLTFAKMDFESAKYLNGAPFHPRPLSVICYHCQQAAEKAIKALIVYFGSLGGLPKVHDLSFLLNQIKNVVQEEKGIAVEDELLTIADSLSKYGVAPRYPNEIDVDERMVEKALADSEAILVWVKDVIASKNTHDQSSKS